MKRFALIASGMFLAAGMVVGLTGCDSGGIEEGIPKETTTPAIDIGKMANMKDSPGVMGKAIPKAPDTTSGETPAPEKK